jgi:hypothetical protein
MPDNLQFERAEPTPGASTGTLACKTCGSVINDKYFVVNGHIVCDNCRRSLEATWDRGGAAGRFGKAVALGILATIGCAVLWYAVLALTDSQWGILAVVVGFVVGGAVRKGSNGRGGWRYQALAIFLTYTAIVSSYLPYMIKGAREEASRISKAPVTASTAASPTDSAGLVKQSAETAAGNSHTPSTLAVIGAIIVAIAFLYALPFVMGFQNLIGLLIIGFALYEAWKLNRRTELRVSGPHQVSMQGARA